MRGKPITKRSIAPDPKFNSILVSKFVNTLMERGKKTIAQTIVYGSFDIIAKQTKKDPLQIFDQAIKNVQPVVEVRSRRIGGANYQIPVEVRGERKNALAFRWILEAARARKGKGMHERLATEIMNAANSEGDAMKKREDVHRMAEANRAFAHFA